MALPTQIGKYQIKGVLGEGAMGIVFEGYDADIERRVAIKTLKPELVEQAGSDFLARFKREAQAVAKCNHQNIVLILEYGTQDQMPYMVMEFVEGWSLSEYLKIKGGLTLKQTLSLIVKLLKALHVAHQQGIVHRDIKPANIMITRKGEVKLADFGIARHTTKNDLTQTGLQIGTPAYMSPEQMVADRTDHRTDLYSLSIVFFELLARVPQSDGNDYGVIDTDHGISLHSRINTQAPVAIPLIPIIERGLQIKPDNRYQNAQEYIKQLLQVSNKLDLSNNTAGKPKPQTNAAADSNAETVVAEHVPQTDPGMATSMTSMTTIGTRFTMTDSLIDPVTFEAMREDLEKLIGDKAGEIIRDEIAINLSKAEAIHAIAQHISKPKLQKKFIDRWSE